MVLLIIFNSWLLLECLDRVVQNAWVGFHGYSSADTYLAAKLKHLNDEIRKWRNKEHKKENKELINTKELLVNLEKVAESRALSPNEMQIRSNSIQKLLELEKRNVIDTKQKSKIRWVVDGDEKSKFFHGYVSNNKRKNQIVGLSINRRWLTGVNDIISEAFHFFRTNLKNNGFLNQNMLTTTSDLLI